MLTITSAQLLAWLGAFLWPLGRILGVMASAPIFGNRSIPATVRVGLSVLLSLIVAIQLPTSPDLDPLSWTGLLVLVNEFLIGVGIGFSWRIVFTGIEMAGELIGSTMGLSFATQFDPMSQGRSSAVSQLLSMLTVLLALSANLHLLFLEVLIQSFHSLPIGLDSVDRRLFQQIAIWGGHMFAIGVQLSLPVVTALLIVNMALGVLTRSAPQLNLFSIGFPVTLGVGIVMIGLCLPYWSEPILKMLREGIQMIQTLTRAL
jgi:flagellar biosynthesis protein FliR